MQVNNINSAHAIPNLAAGNYSLTTIDNNGCSSTTYFSITTPPAIVIAANAIGTKCNSNDGAINIFANGGVAPLQYSIDNGTTFSAASVFNNLAAGSYTVVVKDANGCTSSQVVSVAPSSTPVINSSPVTQVSLNIENGGIQTHGRSQTVFRSKAPSRNAQGARGTKAQPASRGSASKGDG